MKIQHLLLALLALISGTTPLQAQFKWANPLDQTFSVVRGQGWQDELKGTYVRLPQRAQQTVRKQVWDLSQNSAGLSVAFRTSAPVIKVRYVVKGNHAMSHMPATGVSGVDLYATDSDGKSRWCGGKFSFRDTITYTYSKLSYETRPKQGYEYQLYLPLYNQIAWMEIGIPAKDSLRFLPVSQEKPIVIYGTSITQGACASRPGMAWANIVERKSTHPVVNLGFSGNGRLEEELFELLSEIDAQLYIIDCLPNLAGKSATTIYDRTLQGVRKLRSRSKAPILLVEHSGYTNEYSSAETRESYLVANVELRKAYEALRQEGFAELHYLTKEEIGLSMDAMVEGVHPSDLGMQQYADSYLKKIGEILHERNDGPVTCIPTKQQRDNYDWSTRHEQILSLNKQAPAPEILMIGNSITHFWGGEPKASRRSGKMAWDKLFSGKSARNLGFGWDKTENVLWRVYHGELDGYQAQKIFLLIGTNNLQSNTDDEIVQGICRAAEAIKQRQPQADVYVIGILPRKGEEFRTRIQQINAHVQKQLSGSKIHTIDLSRQFADRKGVIDASLFSDGLHPNEQGYAKMAEVLKQYL